MEENVTNEQLNIYHTMIQDELKTMQVIAGVSRGRVFGIPSGFKKEDFIEHFKENPDLLAEIITELRRYKIEKILNNGK